MHAFVTVSFNVTSTVPDKVGSSEPVSQQIFKLKDDDVRLPRWNVKSDTFTGCVVFCRKVPMISFCRSSEERRLQMKVFCVGYKTAFSHWDDKLSLWKHLYFSRAEQGQCLLLDERVLELQFSTSQLSYVCNKSLLRKFARRQEKGTTKKQNPRESIEIMVTSKDGIVSGPNKAQYKTSMKQAWYSPFRAERCLGTHFLMERHGKVRGKNFCM